MTPTAGYADVVRDADGAVRITAAPVPSGPELPSPAPDFAQTVLDVAGAVLAWPLMEAGGPPSARIHDPGRAQQWLWAVYGERVAAAVHDLTAADGPSRVPVAAGALAGAAARLGLGHWALRWWPASGIDAIAALAPDLLGLEVAALTHHCHQLFDDGADQPDDCAAELIEEHEAGLDPLIRWWRTGSGPTGAADRVADVLRLLDDAADSAGLDGPGPRHLRAQLERDHQVDAHLDLGALFARPGGYALAAGRRPDPGGRTIARGTGANDWHRYPPGLLDSAETAVSWAAHALGARREIEVEALAHPAAPTAAVPLAAEVRVDGRRPLRVPLVRGADSWGGRAELELADGAGPVRIEVGVLLPGFDPGPDDPAGTAARAARDAVRELARRRLSAAAGPVPSDGSAHHTPGTPFLAETVAAATDEDY
ncbi:hypothetical protein ACFWXK_13350 [Streptomyces sp. NPDC059070]|uniref:hypothetical protein n=1 Tax=Streptomyces sp. NPDC059070 TaxID=3346713 RepID=UPI003694B967